MGAGGWQRATGGSHSGNDRARRSPRPGAPPTLPLYFRPSPCSKWPSCMGQSISECRAPTAPPPRCPCWSPPTTTATSALPTSTRCAGNCSQPCHVVSATASFKPYYGMRLFVTPEVMRTGHQCCPAAPETTRSAAVTLVAGRVGVPGPAAYWQSRCIFTRAHPLPCQACVQLLHCAHRLLQVRVRCSIAACRAVPAEGGFQSSSSTVAHKS